jgi:Tol biopolymer transport system component
MVSELKGTLEAIRRQVVGSPDAFERVARSRRRRQRNKRIGAAVLALAVAGLAVWGLTGAFLSRLPQAAGDKAARTSIWALTFDRNNQRVTARHKVMSNGTEDVEPALSPDGKRIAFSTDRDGNREIYAMNADGSDPVNLTRNPAQDMEPAWSPDGKFIAFVSTRDGNFEIYVMDANGRHQTPLTHDVAKELSPTWSPDGTRIAFSKETGPRETQLFVMNADGSGPTQITSQRSNFSPAWSPDGEWIACVSNRDGDRNIYLIRPDGKGEPAKLTSKASADYGPAWAPDSKWLAFVSDRSGTKDIWLMDAVAQKVWDVTQGSDVEFGPVWQGDTIYYSKVGS